MRDDTATGAAPRAGRQEWIGLAVLALPTLLVALDIGSLFLALPHLTADLGASSIQQLWITDIYGFLLAGFLITMGTLGDRIGRRRLLLIGAAVFGVASVFAAYSTGPLMLIITRALLGIAGATLMPSTLALIRNMFVDPRQLGVAISVWMSCQMAGAAIGPVIGGLLLTQFWWGSVFLMGVPVMAVLLVTGPMLLPEYRNPDAARLELPSVALSLLAILPIIYGIKELATNSAGTRTVPVAAIVVGVVFGVVFVRRQLRLTNPLLDLRLFSDPSFAAALAAMLLAAGAMAGSFLLVSQYVQTVLGLSPARAGLWLAPTGLSIAVGSLLAPHLARRVRQGAVITGGLALAVVGFVLITQVDSVGGLALVVIGIAIVHLGAGPLYALGTGMIISSVPPVRAGSAASMSETSTNFGSTLGLALLGTVGTAIYRHQMADFASSAVSARSAETARQTIAGATDSAQHLPAAPAANLLHTARDAFTDGLNAAAWVGTVLFVGLVILTAVALRDRDRTKRAGQTARADGGVGEIDPATSVGQ